MTRKCFRCKEWKPESHFCKDSSRKDGVSKQCRQCASAYYFTHRKGRLEYQKKYNRENREKIRRYKQEYYLKHILETQDIDAILECAKSIYNALPEEFIIGELERCLGEKQS